MWRGPGELNEDRIVRWENECNELLGLLEQCERIIAGLMQDRPDSSNRELNKQIQLARGAARNERESIRRTAEDWRKHQKPGPA